MSSRRAQTAFFLLCGGGEKGSGGYSIFVQPDLQLLARDHFYSTPHKKKKRGEINYNAMYQTQKQ